MNKAILLIFAALAVIVIAETKEIRQKFTMENMCREKPCTEKCQTNGYVSGHCQNGDTTEFCICGDCVADKCTTSCAKDKLKGSCESGENGRCVCD